MSLTGPSAVYFDHCLVCDRICYQAPKLEPEEELGRVREIRELLYNVFSIPVGKEVIESLNKAELPLCPGCILKLGRLKELFRQLKEIQQEFDILKESIAFSIVDIVASGGTINATSSWREAEEDTIRASLVEDECDTLKQIIFGDWHERQPAKAKVQSSSPPPPPKGAPNKESHSKLRKPISAESSIQFKKPTVPPLKKVLSSTRSLQFQSKRPLPPLPKRSDVTSPPSFLTRAASRILPKLSARPKMLSSRPPSLSITPVDRQDREVKKNVQNVTGKRRLSASEDDNRSNTKKGSYDMENLSITKVSGNYGSHDVQQQNEDEVGADQYYPEDIGIGDFLEGGAGELHEDDEENGNDDEQDPLRIGIDDENATENSNGSYHYDGEGNGFVEQGSSSQLRGTVDPNYVRSLISQLQESSGVDFCGSSVENLEFLQNEEGQYVCMFCNKAFIHKYPYRDHLKTHTGEGPKCPICGKIFPKNHNLMLHLRTHTGEKPFTCDVCSKGFADKSNLKVHYRVHTGEKPYKCEYCNQAFVNSSRLVVHRRLHTGEKPFACGLCAKAFSTANQLSVHRRLHGIEDSC